MMSKEEKEYKTDIDFIVELFKYIPTRSREDAGVDFNLKKVHWMIEKYLNEAFTEERISSELMAHLYHPSND